MATTPPVSPHEETDNDIHQPPITSSPVPSPPLPTEYVEEFTNSISPSSPPQLPENSSDGQQLPPPEENSDGQQEPPVPPSPPPEEQFDRQQPPPPEENSDGQQETPVPPSPPPEEQFNRQQPPQPAGNSIRQQPLAPPSPPPTATEQPQENFIESPLSKQPPSPLTPKIEAEFPAENADNRINPNPNDHESPSKQPRSPNLDPIESPNYRENSSPNPNLDHDSIPSSPAKLEPNISPKAIELPKDPSPSPSPPLGVPLLLQAAPGSSPMKPQISPWTNQETANLIQAYQEKWYSLKKGSLKAGQWEEVAITVAARCGYDEPTKTAKQCRHKLEKLRKRYRAERAKPRAKALAWNFFKLMDDLEKGPLPISSSPPVALEYQKPNNSKGKKRKSHDDEEEEEEDGDHEFLVNKRSSRSRSYNHHVPNGYLTRNLQFTEGGSRVVRGLRTPVVHKHRGFYQQNDDAEEEEEEEKGGEEEGVVAQLAVEIKGFAEKFVKMENKKIEMIRDVERYRLEMENKRMEMILESQQMLVETVNKAFHKTHRLSAN